jgi:hypothetical protein
MNDYWVYEDFVTHQAKVHRGCCPHSNHGTGHGRGRNERENRWLGRFASAAEARAAPIRANSVLENCKICMVT